MKLLLDQNISFRITNKIQELFPGSKQVRDLGLENCKDSFLQNYAKENKYCIVTFDGDFYDLGLIKGFSPKVIWLRLGNTSAQNIENVQRKNYDLIKTFLTDPNYVETDSTGVKAGQTTNIDERIWIDDKFVFSLTPEMISMIKKVDEFKVRFYFGPIPATFRFKGSKLKPIHRMLNEQHKFTQTLHMIRLS